MKDFLKNLFTGMGMLEILPPRETYREVCIRAIRRQRLASRNRLRKSFGAIGGDLRKASREIVETLELEV